MQWVCWDRTNVVTSLVHEALSRWAFKHTVQLQQQTADSKVTGQQPLGLSVWAAWEFTEVDSICQSMMRLGKAQSQAVKLVVVSESCVESSSRLVQAGAQLVVHPLSSLERALMVIAGKIPVVYQSNHPLTQGIMQRSELSVG